MFKIILPKLLLNIERWKWNEEYRIYVSNTGKFKNEYKKPMPILINQKGYITIKTPYGLKLAHRLVMLTWNPIPNAEDLTVDHLDHNKRNNAVNNLEWITKAENLSRAANDKISASNYENSKIRCGNQVLNSLDEAIDYALNNLISKTNKTPCRENIKKRIANAISNNTLYCGRKWKEIQ